MQLIEKMKANLGTLDASLDEQRAMVKQLTSSVDEDAPEYKGLHDTVSKIVSMIPKIEELEGKLSGMDKRERDLTLDKMIKKLMDHEDFRHMHTNAKRKAINDRNKQAHDEALSKEDKSAAKKASKAADAATTSEDEDDAEKEK